MSTEKKYTDNEMTDLMDKADVRRNLSYLQLFYIAYWSMFNRRKLYEFCHNLEKGMSAFSAFRTLKS